MVNIQTVNGGRLWGEKAKRDRKLEHTLGRKTPSGPDPEHPNGGLRWVALRNAGEPGPVRIAERPPVVADDHADHGAAVPAQGDVQGDRGGVVGVLDQFPQHAPELGGGGAGRKRKERTRAVGGVDPSPPNMAVHKRNSDLTCGGNKTKQSKKLEIGFVIW